MSLAELSFLAYLIRSRAQSLQPDVAFKAAKASSKEVSA
jgi:hypothetical protein